MNYQLAPMEAVTTYIYRNALEEVFSPMDSYVTPFLSPTQKHLLNHREYQEIAPEHNKGKNVVPQVLSKEPILVGQLSKELKEMGYRKMNLNLGCPSKTVTSKGKGAGMLGDLAALERYLDGVFESSQIEVSVKTRLGVRDRDEFWEILKIYERFPLQELIVHPRVLEDYYGNQPDWDLFGQVQKQSRLVLIYNGDLSSKEEVEQFLAAYPDTAGIMLGRGIIRDPSLKRQLDGGPSMTKDQFLRFQEILLEGYLEISSGEKNALFKMKEVMSYMGDLFPTKTRQMKKVKKSQTAEEYRKAVRELVEEAS